MIITWKDRRFEFRECDVIGRTQEEVERMAKKHGYMQYEPTAYWLVVPSVGYGWEVER